MDFIYQNLANFKCTSENYNKFVKNLKVVEIYGGGRGLVVVMTLEQILWPQRSPSLEILRTSKSRFKIQQPPQRSYSQTFCKQKVTTNYGGGALLVVLTYLAPHLLKPIVRQKNLKSSPGGVQKITTNCGGVRVVVVMTYLAPQLVNLLAREKPQSSNFEALRTSKARIRIPRRPQRFY
ncbi:hypothetical protein QE152_g33021 [Popillia japonica]|uniref:Uncharacterized protein n=1 Tax=Popillia japonica TaxID=7064 RepID=A0AAW1IYL8_POPJA